MSKTIIDYSLLVDNAMHLIVKKSLEILSSKDFHGDHHFFISFITKHPKVELSSKLKAKYPDEMTIVLQYQYEDLIVTDKFFSVLLSFDNVKEKIVIPFESLTSFADPSVKFGLQFRHFEDDFEDDEFTSDNDSIVNDSKKNKIDSNVVTLDHFRKK